MKAPRQNLPFIVELITIRRLVRGFLWASLGQSCDGHPAIRADFGCPFGNGAAGPRGVFCLIVQNEHEFHAGCPDQGGHVVKIGDRRKLEDLCHAVLVKRPVMKRNRLNTPS